MFKVLLLLLFSILCYIVDVHCYFTLNKINTESEQCTNLCTDSAYLLPIIKDVQSICQRGCRFFSLIYARDAHNLSGTKDECYSSCKESYDIVTNAKDACNTGCNVMLKQKENDMVDLLVFLEQDSSKNFIFKETDVQMWHGHNPEYKIPETVIRTMPVAAIIEEEWQQRDSGNWLDCAAKYSGIPKWILMSTIIIGVLVTLWLSISSQKKHMQTENVCKQNGVHLIDKNDPRLLGDTQYCRNTNENDVNFSVPMKCMIETEKE